MHQQQDRYFVVTHPGFEQICAHELSAAGIQPVATTRGGVEFDGGLRELYLANLWLRTASRILVRLGEVTARDFPTLFQRLARLPWGRFIKSGIGCDIRASASGSRLTHTGRIAETCGAAIARALGEEQIPCQQKGGQKIFLRLHADRCLVSVDSSGDHLHRRGYLKARGAAPLRETLAAGCLLAVNYDGSRPLIDLMTGSGTLAIEAAMIALCRAPGRERSFAFMQWPKFRRGLWDQLLVAARREEKSLLPAPILGVDNNPKAIAAARQNLEDAGLAGLVQLNCANMQQLAGQSPPGLLICNPPYGGRLGKNASLRALYGDLGRVYGVRFNVWQGLLICPEGELLRATGCVFRPLIRFSNGGIPVALLEKSDELSTPSETS